jgi:hypothetical protein
LLTNETGVEEGDRDYFFQGSLVSMAVKGKVRNPTFSLFSCNYTRRYNCSSSSKNQTSAKSDKPISQRKQKTENTIIPVIAITSKKVFFYRNRVSRFVVGSIDRAIFLLYVFLCDLL